MSATVISDEFVFDKVVNAVIIYDDLSSAAQANAILERAFHRAGEITEWNVKPWRLDLLNQPPIAAEALKETEDAHLIVFAFGRRRPYPIWLFEWLEKWAAQRRIGEAALAVFISGGNDVSAIPIVPELPQFAERHGLNFIFDHHTIDKRSVDLPEGDVALVYGAQQVADDDSAHQHWGINE